MALWLQVVVATLLVTAVIWFMWRLPQRPVTFLLWAPLLALFSAWIGMAALLLSALLWFVSYPDVWVAVLLLLIAPAALAAGVGVMWIHRGHLVNQPAVGLQRRQARVGIALALLAVTLGYVYVMSHKAPMTLVGV